MKIKLLSITAGPDGVRHPGIHDIPDDEARRLVAARFAVMVEPEVKAKPQGVVEQARAKEPETAAIRPSRRVVAKPKDL